MRATETGRVEVYCGEQLAGHLERTAKGSRFTFHQSLLEDPNKPPRGIARHLPYERAVHETVGVNLHTYFAGLLPEGLRLQTLIGRARTSPDDLFSLLIEAGPDSIGDVYAKAGDVPIDEPLLDLATLGAADFAAAEESLRRDARQASIPGAQPKLSAATIALTLGGRRSASSAILKLSPEGYPNLIENEMFFMGLAKRCGIGVADCRVVRDKHGRGGLLVTRFDRLYDKPSGVMKRVYQEDACQLCDRYPADKYRLSMRQVTEAIASWCDAPKVSITRLVELYMFSYVIGNADLHAKNISVWRNPSSGLIELSPVYDLVSTLAYPNLATRMALKMGAKDDSFRVRDFTGFAAMFYVPEKAVLGSLNRIATKVEDSLGDLPAIGLEPSAATRMRSAIEKRLARLRP